MKAQVAANFICNHGMKTIAAINSNSIAAGLLDFMVKNQYSPVSAAIPAIISGNTWLDAGMNGKAMVDAATAKIRFLLLLE